MVACFLPAKSFAQPLVKLPPETGPIVFLTFSRDGKFLASITTHKADGIKLWNAADGKLIQTLENHPHQLGSCIFTPDSKELVSIDHGNMARIWDLTTFKVRKAFAIEASGLAAVTPDGKILLVTIRKGTTTLYDLETGKQVAVLKEPPTVIRSMALSPDGKLLATGCNDGTVTVWDLTGRKQQHVLSCDRSVAALSFSPNGKSLAVGSSGGFLAVWNMITGQEKGKGKPDRLLSGIKGVAFTPDGERLALVGNGRINVLLVDAKYLTQIPEFRGEGHPKNSMVQCLALSPDGKTLATGGNDDFTIILRKLPSPKPRE